MLKFRRYSLMVSRLEQDYDTLEHMSSTADNRLLQQVYPALSQLHDARTADKRDHTHRQLRLTN